MPRFHSSEVRAIQTPKHGLILPSRRAFIAAAAGFLATPAIVHAGSPLLLGAGKSGSVSTGLQTNLSAFWQFANTSWLDSTGNGSTLAAAGTNAVTVGTGPGGLNTCAVFDGTNWLSCASNSHLITNNTTFSISAWINNGAALGQASVVSKRGFGFQTDEWGLGGRFTSGNFWQAVLWDNAGNSSEALTAAAEGTGSWTHFALTYNVSTNFAQPYINGSASGPGDTLAAPINSSASATMNINMSAASTSAGTNSVALVGIWQGRLLSAGDITLLYNSGNGRTFAQMA